MRHLVGFVTLYENKAQQQEEGRWAPRDIIAAVAVAILSTTTTSIIIISSTITTTTATTTTTQIETP